MDHWNTCACLPEDYLIVCGNYKKSNGDIVTLSVFWASGKGRWRDASTRHNVDEPLTWSEYAIQSYMGSDDVDWKHVTNTFPPLTVVVYVRYSTNRPNVKGKACLQYNASNQAYYWQNSVGEVIDRPNEFAYIKDAPADHSFPLTGNGVFPGMTIDVAASWVESPWCEMTTLPPYGQFVDAGYDGGTVILKRRHLVRGYDWVNRAGQVFPQPARWRPLSGEQSAVAITYQWHTTSEKKPTDGTYVIADYPDGETVAYYSAQKWRYDDMRLAPEPVRWRLGSSE